MEIMVHSKNSVSATVSKEIVQFQQKFQTGEFDVKMIQLDFRSQESDKKIQLTLSVVRNPTLAHTQKTPDSLQVRLCNPDWYFCLYN